MTGKETKDKRCVSDLRHINTRMAKNNLAFPFISNMFSVLGSSICKIISVIDLKDACHSL